MNYTQGKEWLESLGTKMSGFDLETTKKLVELSGLEPASLRAIHVAGSNGKGSTCAFVERILREQGYKTGLYTSPHLVEPAERIQINGKKIHEKEFALLANHFRAIMEKNKILATYFEANTAMALKHFLDEKVDFAAIETGLGGRLDATNIITPLVSVVTSISLEHTQYLGETIEKISREKAGIIKRGSPVIISRENAGAGVIEQIAKSVGAEVIYAEFKKISCSQKGNKFSLVAPAEITGIKTKMIGSHQIENASLAAAACIALCEKGIEVSGIAIRKGLEKAFWPGRLEIARIKPIVLLDGAHNPDGWARLEESLGLFKYKKLIVVFAAMKDKDIKSAKGLLSMADTLIITKPEMERAEEPKRIKEILGFWKAGAPAGKAIRGMTAPEVKAVVPTGRAIGEAIALAGENDLVLITGSLYLVGESYRPGKKASDSAIFSSQ